MNRIFSLALVVTLLFIPSLEAADALHTAVEPGDLIGRTFILESVDGEKFAGERKPFIQFGSQMAVSGAVCNRFRGSATLADGVLRAGEMVSTRMLCPESALSALEPRFFRMLESGVDLTLAGDELRMRSADGEVVFRRDQAGDAEDQAVAQRLIGRKFVLKRMGGEDFVVEEGTQPFIQFAEGLRVSGSACNSFSGPAHIRAGMLVVSNLAATLKLCIDPMLTQFEGLFHQALREGAMVAVDGDTLRLTWQGLVLEFEAES